MREILFRGKRVDNGEWFYGVPTIDSRGQTVIVENVFDCDEYNCRGASCLYVDENTIGQYTGLTDKNGKKIFEGDIVSERPPMNSVAYIGNVVWDEEATLFRVVFGKPSYGCILGTYSRSYTVIGNIHDNPELLKDGDDK